MRKSIGIKSRLGSVGISQRKKGIGLKGKARLLGVGVGGKFGVHKKGANIGSSVSLGKARARVKSKVKFNGGLKARTKTRIGISKKPVATANIGSGITKKEAYANAKLSLLGLAGASAGGDLKYGKGLPSVSGRGSVTFGGEKLGGSLQLGGNKIINANLTLPLVGKVINLYKDKKPRRRTTKSTRRRTTKSTRRSTTKSTKRR